MFVIKQPRGLPINTTSHQEKKKIVALRVRIFFHPLYIKKGGHQTNVIQISSICLPFGPAVLERPIVLVKILATKQVRSDITAAATNFATIAVPMICC